MTGRRFAAEEAAGLRRIIRQYLGDGEEKEGRAFTRGYDKDGRACFHFIARNSPLVTKTNTEGCIETYFYVLEKSIACTERRVRELGHAYGEGPTTVSVSVDFRGFASWHAPPMHVLKDMISMLKDHYPERLHRVYLVDAPILFRALWNLLKPFVDPVTKTKFQFITGVEARIRAFDQDFGSTRQTMPYQQPGGQCSEPVNMETYFRLPIDVGYDDDKTLGKDE